MTPPIYVRYTDLSGLPEAATDALLLRLPPAQRAALLRYHQPIDRLRGAAGKWMLLQLLQELGHDEHVLERLRADAYHRPFLDETLDFNITHSGGLVALALVRGGRIGIDVEEVHDLSLDDYTAFFTEAELRSMRGYAAPMDRFFELWTKKEAVMKANGKGMHLPVSDIDLSEAAARCEGREWTLVPLDLLPGYAAHLATEGAAPIDVRQVLLPV